jgi:hypothetical protein
VHNKVGESAATYESQRKGFEARKWLASLSLRIQFHGTVLDVFAQHHPEYVALVWGSTKLLLTARTTFHMTFHRFRDD